MAEHGVRDYGAAKRKAAERIGARDERDLPTNREIEVALRECYRPEKINLASFGNVVPHLHWHLIPRYLDDRHFPQPVWGQAQRKGGGSPAPEVEDARLALAIRNAIAEHLAG